MLIAAALSNAVGVEVGDWDVRGAVGVGEVPGATDIGGGGDDVMDGVGARVEVVLVHAVAASTARAATSG